MRLRWLAAAELRTGVRSTAPSVVDGAVDTAAQPLSALLPGAPLPRGAASVISGSTSLLLAMVAASQRSGEWVAVVGMPELGYIPAADAGLALERLVAVPRVAHHGAETVAALIDGLTYVVVGPEVALSAGERRRLLARAREKDVALISTGQWENSALRMTATGHRWSGPEAGGYYLRRPF